MRLDDKMAELLACPVDWNKESSVENSSVSVLVWDWQLTLWEHAPFCEIEYYLNFSCADDDSEADDDPEVEQHLVNISLLRPDAIKAYARRAGRLSGLRFITPSEQGKHFVPQKREEVVISCSSKRRSLFFENYTPSALKGTFWTWLLFFFDEIHSLDQYREMMDSESPTYNEFDARLWRKFLNDHRVRIAFNSIRSAGASDKERTSFVCLDVHLDNKTVHAFPISKAKAVQIMDGQEHIMNIDALNC